MQGLLDRPTVRSAGATRSRSALTPRVRHAAERRPSVARLRVVTLVALVTAVAASCASASPQGETMNDRFAPCPESPNCVSSYATDETHGIDPLPLPENDPIGVVREIVESMPRTAIVTAADDYLHATFTSRVFRFVDDVEFRVDREAGVVHVRSASRVGYGDMGVNRRRVEEIRELLRKRIES